ncbi:hypothetical protein [Bacteroides acidifaciens]|uniref:hypothetical protein n=1 Tax=Bacteroides acidifaciens TaxID=85831 RepID=UPI0030157642
MNVEKSYSIYQSFTHSKYNSENVFPHTIHGIAAQQCCSQNSFKAVMMSIKIFRNEIGAAWVLQSEYSTIVVPGFEIPDIKGAINPRKLAIVLNDKKHIRSSLNKFRERFLDLFNLPNLDDDIVWENNRNSFIEVVLQKDKLTE